MCTMHESTTERIGNEWLVCINLQWNYVQGNEFGIQSNKELALSSCWTHYSENTWRMLKGEDNLCLSSVNVHFWGDTKSCVLTYLFPKEAKDQRIIN